MIRYAVLGSGSSGNSYLFSTSSSAVLIDAGFSFRDLCRRIAEASLDLSLVTGLCITHLHPDHCRGAGVFARKTGRAVHVHAAVLHRQDPELVNLGIPSGQMRGFLPAHTFTVGDFAITPFPTSHDSPDSVGFSIRSGNRCFTVLTTPVIVGGIDTATHREGQRHPVPSRRITMSRWLTSGPVTRCFEAAHRGERRTPLELGFDRDP